MSKVDTTFISSLFDSTDEPLCGVGTYEFGNVLGIGVDDGLVKPVSSSALIMGHSICQEDKTVTADDVNPRVKVKKGVCYLSSSGVSANDVGKPVYGVSGAESSAVTPAGTVAVGVVFAYDALDNTKAAVRVDAHFLSSSL